MLESLINLLINTGKPKTFCVRDEYVYDLFYDLCKKAKIELVISEKLPSIDEFSEAVNNRYF
ncbi:DUF6930 domain-containing protein [Sedimentibacter sp.]|uniref:DUF6930 domain-containing protein n=1 Tax=Sedimentibacter sp. TaxID=1960295 RepID=UPI0037DA0A4C